MPVMSIAKPSSIVLTFFLRSVLAVMNRIIPIKARNGVKVEGLNMDSQALLPLSMAFSESSQALAVVPRLAPSITLTAWDRFMMPELTKPTTITVEVEDDCTSAVTPTPKRYAINRFCVTPVKNLSNVPPEILLRPLLMTLLP